MNDIKKCDEQVCACFAECQNISEHAGIREETLLSIMHDIRENEPVSVMRARYVLPFVDFYIFHKEVLNIEGSCCKSLQC